MKIFIICSKYCYPAIPPIQTELEAAGHTVVLPNAYDDPEIEERHRRTNATRHADWKRTMIKQSAEKVANTDAVFVLNMKKHDTPNYIGGATFLEMYEAFRLEKKIFLYNTIPEGILHDEVCGMQPTILNGNLSLIHT
jgi:hypothetical protein